MLLLDAFRHRCQSEEFGNAAIAFIIRKRASSSASTSTVKESIDGGDEHD
jgi:hypothetical protein